MASTSSSSSLPPPLLLAQAGGRSGAPRQGVERVTFDIPPFTPPADRPTEPPAVARPAAEAPAAAPTPAAEADMPPLIDVRLAEPEAPAPAPAPEAPAPAPVEAPPQIDVALDPAPTATPEPVPAPVPTPDAPPQIEAEAPHIDVAVAEPVAEAAPHAEAETVAYIAHPPAHEAQVHDEHGATGPIDVSVEMFLWTLGTFLLMAWLLTKLAWRPILGALDKREEELRQAVDNAEQVRVELDTIEEKRSHIILDADTKAKEIVDRARIAGREAGRVLTEKAKQEAVIIQENTRRELNTAREKAAADLRQESVDRAIELTEKFLEQKMTPAQQRKLTERLIDQI